MIKIEETIKELRTLQEDIQVNTYYGYNQHDFNTKIIDIIEIILKQNNKEV